MHNMSWNFMFSSQSYHINFFTRCLSSSHSRLAHVVTSSVTAQVQNRPSSKNITVQTTVGRLTARGFDCGTSGAGGEGPIIVSSKHNEEGKNYIKREKTATLECCVFSIITGFECGHKPSQQHSQSEAQSEVAPHSNHLPCSKYMYTHM